jgi:hypothetical protein
MISQEKNFDFLQTKPLKCDTQPFYKRNLQLILIRLNKHNIHYVKQWFQQQEAYDIDIYS